MPSEVERTTAKRILAVFGDLGAMACWLHPEVRSYDVNDNTVAPSVSPWSKSFTW